uniref:Uncharacterized protein n=1 Tax=Oryza barthii TaxID=65489 RepID=A0A0D3GEP5_9ORYZ
MLSPAHLAVVAAALLLALRPPLPAVPVPSSPPASPPPTEATATARWLAAQNTWGVLSFSIKRNS